MKNSEIVVALVLLLTTACGTQTESSTTSGTPPSDQPVITAPEKPPRTEIVFKELGLIREFSPTDRAALFGLLPARGKLEISKVGGPSFIHGYKVGELNETSVSRLFASGAKPLSATERQNLLTTYAGATVIYAEGYDDNLCTPFEQPFAITATGKVEGVDIEIAFKFTALPSSTGNCSFHVFGTELRYTN